ncbi:MAG: adenine phosphoribosyltransferase [Clostridiaceae bacterium]|jgi:adenine phosphoribosyltransferase|nr:adenine phosphoribosyltransferase [Clostridiaceae bacterium]
MNLEKELRHIPNFPRPGVDFIDITTLLKNKDAFREAIDQTADMVRDLSYDLIIGAESRGFILGAPLAYATGHGFAPVRKQGKLPGKTIQAKYQLEYGEDILEIHVDAIQPGMRILVVDDLLATGGTARANCQLVEKLGGVVAGVVFFIELIGLKGREKLNGYPVYSLLKIEEKPV